MLCVKQEEKKIEKQKYLYLEVMRIIAIFFVIFNHTEGFFIFSTYPVESLNFWVYLFLSVFCKFSVPLFFAISGAIMLGKEEESLKVIFKKRILRFIKILIIISIIYYIYSLENQFNNFNIKTFFEKFYTESMKGHLWYLYAYIAFLISLPLLRMLVKNLENKHYYYMIGIALIFNGIIPTIEYLLWQGEYSINVRINPSWIYTDIVLYPCIGYFLQNKIKISKPKKVILILWIVNILTIIISCYMTYYKSKITGELSEEVSQAFYKKFVLINCICMYITIKYVIEHIKIPEYLKKLIFSMGSCTFGIYLFHEIIKRNYIVRILFNIIRSTVLNYMISTFIWCFCIMIINYILVLILKKIPILNKIIDI